MFNFWLLFFPVLSVMSLIILFWFTTPLQFLLISEFGWLCLITSSILLTLLFNDVRYLIMAFFLFFIAAVEVVLYLIFVLNTE